MITKSTKIFFLAAIIAFYTLCQGKQNRIDTSGNITPHVVKNITVYGSENCDHCLEFRQKADSLKIKYAFKDAEANEANYNELVRKIQQTGVPGYISFPVVEINEKLYIRPEFEEFLRLIAE